MAVIEIEQISEEHAPKREVRFAPDTVAKLPLRRLAIRDSLR
jgi:hypothetical protein